MKEGLKVLKTEECGRVRIEAYRDAATISHPLLTFTYNKHLGMFLLTIERMTITQHKTLKALIEVLREMEEVVEDGEVV